MSKNSINVKEVVSNFKIIGKLVAAKRFGNGHINDTFLIRTTKRFYILQRINNNVFKDPILLMNNVISVNNFLVKKKFPTLTYIRNNKNQYIDTNKYGYFRMYYFKQKVVSFEEIINLEMVEEMARAFGKLHKSLYGFDAKNIKDTIPNFHNTPFRFQKFLKVVEKDPCNRKKTCVKEINYLLSQKNNISKVADGLKDNSIHECVIHNDTKINNVLFNRETHKFACVIDFDTLMKGSLLYDYGDALRSLFTGDNEDTTDLSLIKVEFGIFKAFSKGYLSEAKTILNEKEISLLPYSIYLMSIELALRFLKDYLQGDTYFKVSFLEHNLIRARTQIQLSKLILTNFQKLNEIIGKLV